MSSADNVDRACLPGPTGGTARTGGLLARPAGSAGGIPAAPGFRPELIIGSIGSGKPIQDPRILDSDGHTVGYAFHSLAFGEDFQRGADDSQGISGGPLYDCALKRIVGEDFAAWDGRRRVFAAELSWLKGLWEPFAGIAEEFLIPPHPPRGVTGKIVFDSLIEHRTRGFVGRFVGREWLAERLGQFLEAEDRGYFVIEGAIGIGKTAFACWLAVQRGGKIGHFYFALAHPASTVTFL